MGDCLAGGEIGARLVFRRVPLGQQHLEECFHVVLGRRAEEGREGAPSIESDGREVYSGTMPEVCISGLKYMPRRIGSICG